MAYKTDITNLSPDHAYYFDGDYNDSVGTSNGTNSGCIVTEAAIAEDATNSMTTNSVADIVTLPSVANINQENDRKAVGGWFMTTAIQQPPVRIYGEGDTNQAFAFHMGFGNAIIFEVDTGNFTLQIYGDTPLVENRPYHLLMKFESNTYGDEVSAYLDGVKQLDSADVIPSNVLTNRPAGEFGGKSSGLALGGTALKIVSPVNGRYNHWSTWSAANAILTDTEIREELFEKGALTDTTITNQAGLDALADTLRPNYPVCIRVTGNGTIDLSADNVTFDPLASVHVQYTGTGTLNWTNTNGSNASIGSVTNGGTINFINPATLTINGVINGAEVRIYDDETVNTENFDTELDGIESNIGTSFEYSHSGATNTVIIQMMATGYEEVLQSVDLGSTDQTITLFPIQENNQ